MKICFMKAWFAFNELNHVRNRQYSNGILALQEKKSHAKLIRVTIEPLIIYSFKQQTFAYLQLSNFQI